MNLNEPTIQGLTANTLHWTLTYNDIWLSVPLLKTTETLAQININPNPEWFVQQLLSSETVHWSRPEQGCQIQSVLEEHLFTSDHLCFLLLPKNTPKSTERRHSRGDSGTRPASKTSRVSQSVCRDSCGQKIKPGFYNNLLRSWPPSKQPMIFNSGPSDKFPFSRPKNIP